MSMRPRVLAAIPEQTVAVARAAFRKPTLAMRVRDELGEVFADEAFLDVFGLRGKPGISPGQLVMITVLQFAENLTDRQAADAVRSRSRRAAGVVVYAGRRTPDAGRRARGRRRDPQADAITPLTPPATTRTGCRSSRPSGRAPPGHRPGGHHPLSTFRRPERRTR